jgi:tetratricopeptide (TPR) repeat protein
MEALVFFVFFGLYILVRVLMGGGTSAWEKQRNYYKEGLQLFKIKHLEEAKDYFEAALKKRPYDSFNYVLLGEIAYHQLQPERALAYGQRALRMDNTIWQAHLLMAKSFYLIDRQEEAFQNAKNAAWFGREAAEAQFWFGKLLLEKGETTNALQYLSKAYKLGEEDAGPILKSLRYSTDL